MIKLKMAFSKDNIQCNRRDECYIYNTLLYQYIKYVLIDIKTLYCDIVAYYMGVQLRKCSQIMQPDNTYNFIIINRIRKISVYNVHI